MPRIHRLFGFLKRALPPLYVLGAFLNWVLFMKTNPDGLANLGLVLYTFPVAVVGTFLLKREFPYFPGKYYVSHSVYFWISVSLLAYGLYGLLKMAETLAGKPTESKVPSENRPSIKN